ncbi:MAG: hypothetical protein M1817_000086 [Caeruleum heppii]|nr:MAG: hypothetical protein M1817_000086 [Caeruleum heppii]
MEVFNALSIALDVASLVTCLAFLLLDSHRLFARFRLSQTVETAPGGSRYTDKDGVATSQSEAAFSDTIPRIIIILTSLAGLCASLAASVAITLKSDFLLLVESWLQFACWVCLLLLAINIFTERKSVLRFTCGVRGAISASILAIALGIGHMGFVRKSAIVNSDRLVVGLTSAQLLAALLLIAAHLSLPRRPDVFTQGHPVDRQRTVSVLGRYTFAWCEPLLRFAVSKRNLDLEDLPKLDCSVRSTTLQASFNAVPRKGRRLWRLIFWAHSAAFVRQWCLTLLGAFASFVPHLVMYKLLRLLERREEGGSIAMEAWLWVFGLGLAQVVESWLEAWMFWVCWCQLAVPVRAQLSALIFAKAMRRKDIKGFEKGDDDAEDSQDPQRATDLESGPKGEDSTPTEDKSHQKTKQSQINLIGIDAKRVSDFASFNDFFPSTVVMLTVSLTFLFNLIGWQSTLAALLVMVLITPLNVYFSKRYSDAQDRLMKVRDVKMGVVTEALQGIRQIKFSALERQWQNKIGAVRDRELKEQWTVFCADTILCLCWVAGPVLLAAVGLATYALLHGSIPPSIAFTALAIFGTLEVSLAAVPELTTDLLDAVVSCNRIEEYLNSPERVTNTVPAESISFETASIAWPTNDMGQDSRYMLYNLNLAFPTDELSVISGKTGSGKSLLLASILGEADVLAGTIRVPRAPPIWERHDDKAIAENWIIPSSIAFVAQIPWMENATIKENVLFGLPLDAQRYTETIRACALEKDLEMLIDGDGTEIGANGINLSGGQRWRVSFARALYSRAGILLLDDIFSAVDAHVGRHLFEQALTGKLGRGRTRILVTHHVGLCLPRARYTVSLSDGSVQHAGLVEELQRTGSFADILSQEPPEEEALHRETSNDLSRVDTRASAKSAKDAPKKFVEDEARQSGGIKWDFYVEYLKATGGWWFWILAMSAFTTAQIFTLGRRYWVKQWTSAGEVEASQIGGPHQYKYMSQHPTASNDSSRDSDLWFYLGIYVGMSVVLTVVSTLKYFWVFVGSIRGSKVLFEKLAYRVLRAPLRWQDTVPVGRILNRFTSDFNVIDSRMANDISMLFYTLTDLLTIVIACLFVSSWMILFAIALMGLCIHYAMRYLAGARGVKRLESNAKSPMFEQYGSALTGLMTIRAFDKTDVYIERMFSRIDDHARTFWHLWLFNRWMGFRMAMVGAVFATLVAAIVVSIKGISASLAGFALSFALEYTTAVIWSVRRYANMELNMNSTERIVEYSRIEIEDQGGANAPAAWPQEGRLTVDDLMVGYADDLPPVLKGLSFQVEANQRVGVVGRTGAGKSSLTLALFRFLEPRKGSIHIDGIDVSTLKLEDLRSRLAIIPQDPVLFSGTIRSNLDPFDQHSGNELRDALERVHLVMPRSEEVTADGSLSSSTTLPSTPTNQFADLASPITEQGHNLSQGQRQLLCLARALLSRPKMLILDEATSAVDLATDTAIQQSIRRDFTDTTLLVIAHRLSTIADFDRILVLDGGRRVEFDSPKTLWDAKGMFWGMVNESGEKARVEKMVTGRSLDEIEEGEGGG